jgi:hypothetical protein
MWADGTGMVPGPVQCFASSQIILKFVILSEAKDLLSLALTRNQDLRFAQDDKVDLGPRIYVRPRSAGKLVAG